MHTHIPTFTPTWREKLNPLWWINWSQRHEFWWKKNPLHNFTNYVIGVRDRRFRRYGRAPASVWHPLHRWNWAMIVVDCPKLYLPFIAYRGQRVEWYVGWREKGNFGISLRTKGAK